MAGRVNNPFELGLVALSTYAGAARVPCFLHITICPTSDLPRHPPQETRSGVALAIVGRLRSHTHTTHTAPPAVPGRTHAAPRRRGVRSWGPGSFSVCGSCVLGRNEAVHRLGCGVTPPSASMQHNQTNFHVPQSHSEQSPLRRGPASDVSCYLVPAQSAPVKWVLLFWPRCWADPETQVRQCAAGGCKGGGVR